MIKERIMSGNCQVSPKWSQNITCLIQARTASQNNLCCLTFAIHNPIRKAKQRGLALTMGPLSLSVDAFEEPHKLCVEPLGIFPETEV